MNTARNTLGRTACAVLLGTLLGVAPIAHAVPGSGGNAVPVPADYDYDPSRGALHDYCTVAGNDTPGVDFRGACARHDQCMQREGKAGYDACHTAFGIDLASECTWSFPPGPARDTCHLAAHSMETAVRVVN
ncbi:hypothetical protein [Nocardia sp. AG03]|uniref:hypothetical protein n=1 Tax=Nocardia sp. AG03 TaxID=3025312 RepID=UPI00241854C1|nr:hypothetical protein [Nocardia sp. AG03]